MQFDRSERRTRASLKICFLVGLVALFIATLAPIEVRVPLINDKIEHLLAFFALTLLGLRAFGRKHIVPLALGLAAIGGLIEILQGSAFIGRDAELFDWIADLGGIALAMPFARTPTSLEEEPKKPRIANDNRSRPRRR